MLEIKIKQPGGTPGAPTRWYRHEVNFQRLRKGWWQIFMFIGGIIVEGQGRSVWEALGAAIDSYNNWLDWYSDGCSQGAAERIWGANNAGGE